ncbi:MAG: helix-hairpin-helix domain-containing protein [Oligoflexia bacterium]|nr:helix-hairpin-helix domain-containing protein [Oligoflexia bacterium]
MKNAILLGISALALASTAHATVTPDAPDSATGSPNISLNSASVEDLAALDQVDSVEAARIVSLRDDRGRLSSVEALRVLELDEPTLQSLRQGTHLDLAMTKTAKGKHYGSVADVMAEFEGEPTAQQVQAMAMNYTKTHPDMVDGWMKSSRSAYFLPKLNLNYKKQLNYYDKNRYEEDVSNPGTYIPYNYEDKADNDDQFEVKMEWRLDKLIISSERIRVMNEAQDIVKLRDKVLEEVTRLYFDRRRLEVDMLLKPPASLDKQLDNELRLQELSANIDAFTGGGFSAAVAGR